VRCLSWNEVEKHNHPDDCWIVVDGFVYDISGWHDKHPGGKTISILAGEDNSSMFHSNHICDITSLMDQFKIGEVQNYKPDFINSTDVFFETLKYRVKKHFDKTNTDYRNTHSNRVSTLLTALLLIACWICVFFFPPYGLIAAVPMGLATCSLIGSFGHEQIHGNFFTAAEMKNPVTKAGSDVLWGLLIPFMPEPFFHYEHIKHHRYPLNPEHDYDVFALRGFVRLSGDLKRKSHHGYQHIYAPFIYGIYIFIQIINGYTTTFFKSRALLNNPGAISTIVISSLTTFGFYFLIPAYLTNVWWALLGSGIYFLTWQAAIYTTSGVPHMTSTALQRAHSWPEYVCNTTCNLKCGNRLFDWLSGGLNYHLVHHLLPSVPKEHLPAIKSIVDTTCAEFGYPCRTYHSFTTYLRDHYRFLFYHGNFSTATDSSLSQSTGTPQQ